MTGRSRRVVVIGGGAAGLLAAGRAAERGAEVLLLEKMKRPARKLRITGKGRCNITNTAEIADFIERFGRRGQFLRQAFHRFFSTELIELLASEGLQVVTERGGRIFPASGKATDVADTLVRWARRCGVAIETNSAVTKLMIHEAAISGVRCAQRTVAAGAVVLTTGGASYPATGSTGDGYRFLESVGHALVDVRQALVPLETTSAASGRIDGLHLRNVRVQMCVDGKTRCEAFGELVFCEFGVTGPVVLTLSAAAVDALRDGSRVGFLIDLKPGLSEEKLTARLLRDFSARGREGIGSILRGLLPRELIPEALRSMGLAANRRGSTITAGERSRLLAWLKAMPVDVIGYRPFAEAIVTAGGVDTREIDPRTMESKRLAGLYVAGEVLDVNGDTGGYNLQAAFSTGWIAGDAAATRVLGVE